MRATSRLSSPAWLAVAETTSSMRAGSSVGRPVDEGSHHRGGQVVGPHPREGAAVPPDRSPHRVDDEDVGGHGSTLRTTTVALAANATAR